MFVIVQSVLAILQFLLNYKNRLGPYVAVALVNVSVFVALVYAGLAVREGSLIAPAHLLLESTTAAAARERDERMALLQAQLRQEAHNLEVMRSYAQVFLDKNPGVSRVRVGVIHDGVVGIGDKHEFKYDIFLAVAKGGREPGPLVTNQPIAGWSFFLADMIAGKCVLVDLSQFTDSIAIARMASMGMVKNIACPVRTPTGALLGVLFVMWDRGDPVPTGDDYRKVELDAQKIADAMSYGLLDTSSRRP